MSEVVEMKAPCDPVRIEGIGREECRRLLATEQLGRLAFLSDGRPDVLPVNYVIDGDGVVFATKPGAKLWALARSPVAFEVDSIDPSGRSGWSVVIHGVAQEITAADSEVVLERIRALPLAPWPGGERPNVVRLPMTSVTGRRVGHDPVSVSCLRS